MRRMFAVGWVLGMFGAGCTTADAPVEVVPAEEGLTELRGPRGGPVTVDPPLDPARAAHPLAWIGQLDPGVSQCPGAFSGYQLQPLFDVGGTPPPGLARFCAYTAVSPAVAGDPAPRTAFQSLDRDLMVVMFSAGPTLTGIMSDEYAEVFVQQAGRVASSSAGVSGVRLAVVDSTPTHGVGGLGYNHRGHNGHGYTISNMARKLTCDLGGHCLANVTTQLALELIQKPTGLIADTVNGGDFGTLGGLAQAIRREVLDWSAGPPSKLVLNLSLGWHPDYGGDPAAMGAWNAPTRAVYAALMDAACRGAVVVAAAGNRTGGDPSSDVGPLYPGGWEVLTVDATECAARLGGSPATFAAVDDGSLVYAVGGVNEYGEDIGVSRMDARPLRVAFSTQGTVMASAGYAPILSGTSVGTVVVAAAAAAVWQNLPGLTPTEVMELVTASGSPVEPVSAWFCPGGGCGPASWVNVCEALHEACDVKHPGACSRTASPVVCPSTAPYDPLPGAVELAAFAASTPQITPALSSKIRTDSHCGGGAMLLRTVTPWAAIDPCPQEQYYDERVEPWVRPQPPHERCPPCYMDIATGEVYLELVGLGGFGSLSSLTLTIEDGSGLETAMTFNALPVGSKLIINVDPALTTSATSAWVTGTVNNTSYTSELNLVR